MGAVKEAAIQLQINQEKAIQIRDAGTVYRMGMLEACQLIGEVGDYYLSQSDTVAFQHTHQCWRAVWDAINYLMEMEEFEDRS